ncbi:MAG: hypothetical protein NT051_02280 [Candidatus Micrarchaeota archaeon]|nr:hypothetical protein [Candidatus Micrarchaeota archaeon]
MADTIVNNLTSPYLTTPYAHILTDMTIQPSFGSSNQIFCTGDPFNPNAQLQSIWYVSLYDAKFKSNANSPQWLYVSSEVNTNQPIIWLQNTPYQCAFRSGRSPYFNNVAVFTLFMQNCGVSSIQDVNEKTSYWQPSQSGIFTCLSGNTYGCPVGNIYFKAGVGVYCKGTLYMNSSVSSYNRNVAITGSSPSLGTVTLPSTPANISFQLRVNVDSCSATGHSYVDDYSGGDSVYLHNESSAGSFIVWSGVKTITVKDRFTCANITSGIYASSWQFAPNPLYPNNTLSFNVTISNYGSQAVTVLIGLGSPSNFSNPSISTPNPFTLNANGGSQVVRGTVRAPPNAMNPADLNLVMLTTTVDLDCNNSRPSCLIQLDRNFTVNSTPPINITCAIINHSSTFLSGQWAWIQANCTQNGIPVNCPLLYRQTARRTEFRSTARSSTGGIIASVEYSIQP